MPRDSRTRFDDVRTWRPGREVLHDLFHWIQPFVNTLLLRTDPLVRVRFPITYPTLCNDPTTDTFKSMFEEVTRVRAHNDEMSVRIFCEYTQMCNQRRWKSLRLGKMFLGTRDEGSTKSKNNHSAIRPAKFDNSLVVLQGWRDLQSFRLAFAHRGFQLFQKISSPMYQSGIFHVFAAISMKFNAFMRSHFKRLLYRIRKCVGIPWVHSQCCSAQRMCASRELGQDKNPAVFFFLTIEKFMR
mmetsp:Transcript_5037/g.13938  ORF Transcript_5037/g.13938 Transcript_5037/m.13938 type:complete len:241 (+) Transcript_5037:938-1660(+)